MREMQTGGIKRRRTRGGNRGVKEEGTDEIIKYDGGIYSVDSMHKSVRQQTLSHTSIITVLAAWIHSYDSLRHCTLTSMFLITFF